MSMLCTCCKLVTRTNSSACYVNKLSSTTGRLALDRGANSRRPLDHLQYVFLQFGDTLRIFTSTLYGKTNTNLNPDPNRYRRRCPDPNAVIQKKELQIKTEEDGNFKAEKYKIEIEVNILNTTRSL